jgi:hypothetical protein
MTRKITAIATALFAGAALFASAAEACISCNYVPEVVNTPVLSHGGTHSYARKRVYTATKKGSAHEKRTFTKKVAPKKVDVAKSAPIETPAAIEADVETENSAITTSSVDESETKETKKTEAASAEEPKESKNVGCSKFFPTVGMTLEVPCG